MTHTIITKANISGKHNMYYQTENKLIYNKPFFIKNASIQFDELLLMRRKVIIESLINDVVDCLAQEQMFNCL